MSVDMPKSKYVYTVLLALCLLMPATSRAETGCAIVYGQNWAFLFATPKNWEAVCPANEPSGVVVALWPKGTAIANAPGIMYVTVSDKGEFSLEQFAEDEITRFRVQSPKLQVQVANSLTFQKKNSALVRQLSGDQYGNHELVAYADAGNVFLIIVLTSRTQKAFEHLRPAFENFVSTLNPMKIQFQGADKAPDADGKRDNMGVVQPLH